MLCCEGMGRTKISISTIICHIGFSFPHSPWPLRGPPIQETAQATELCTKENGVQSESQDLTSHGVEAASGGKNLLQGEARPWATESGQDLTETTPTKSEELLPVTMSSFPLSG